MYFDNTRFKYMCEYITLILDLLYIDKAKSPKIKINIDIVRSYWK